VTVAAERVTLPTTTGDERVLDRQGCANYRSSSVFYAQSCVREGSRRVRTRAGNSAFDGRFFDIERADAILVCAFLVALLA